MKQNLTAVKLLCFILLLNTRISFAQNQSNGSIGTTISPVAPAPVGSTEAFRFRAGIITQLENQGASLFGFTAADQWHSIGRINGATQTVTGFRAQRAGRGLLLGFDGNLQNTATPTLGDPIVQWGGNSGISVTPGDLLFRSFTSPTSTTTTTRFRIGGNGNAFAQNGFLGHFENGSFGDVTGTAGQWISAGRVNGAAQTLYGTRIQRAGRALVTGFDGPLQTGGTPTLGDAFIQWIGNNSSSVTPGNLDFRVAVNPTNAAPQLVGRMKANGRIYLGPVEAEPGIIGCVGGFFGNYVLNINGDSSGAGITTRVFNTNNSLTDITGIQSQVSSQSGSTYSIVGLASKTNTAGECYGTIGVAEGGSLSTGLYGDVLCSNSPASYGVWGLSSSISPSGSFAGYFSGNVFTTASYLPSDIKLKNSVETETDMMRKVMQLNPVHYYYNKSATKELNMPDKFQHGFIAQELEQLFPEMITEVTTPVLGERQKNGALRKIERMENFKSINYTMLIPILTKAIQEQQQTIEEMKTEMAALRNSQQQTEAIKDQLMALKTSQQEIKAAGNGYSLSQNVPNPFTENTTISYTLPANTATAVLMVTDLNGKMLLQYNLAKGSTQQVINGRSLIAGIYVYSLIVNGNEAISKRMVLTK